MSNDELVKQYVGRRMTLENEIDLLRDDLKQLDTEYKDKLDVAVLKNAIKIKRREGKIRAKASDTYDNFCESLNRLD